MLDATLRPLATVRDYPELHAALRARREELGISFETLAAVSGIPYAVKLLEPRPIIDEGETRKARGRHHGRAIGLVSFEPLLGGLGLALIVAEDPLATARLRSRSDWSPRSEGQVNRRPQSTLDALIEARALALLEERGVAIAAGYRG
jgi:hypothetical protein